MTAYTPLPFIGGAYKDDATSWSAQDCLNFIPVPAERPGTRTPSMLRQAPGATLLSQIGTSPIRGIHDCEGLLLVVCGSKLYTVAPDGTPTERGTIPGAGRVSMAHNQVTGGNQVVIANGQAGYVYDTKTQALTQISDTGFPGATVVEFVDGYIVGIEPSRRYWFISNLADATDYNTLDRSEAEAQPDKITTQVVSHREIVMFGERSFEIYANTGAQTGTFQRIDGAVGEVGCPSRFGAVKIDNQVAFIGHDGGFYVLQGYQPLRISTYAIEQAWSRCNLSQAVCFTYEDRGHKIVYVTFTDGRTWGYDFATQEWHRRGSYGLNFWRMTHLTRWNRKWVAGDFSTGKLYLLDWLAGTEAGAVMERRRTGPVLHADGNRLSVNALRVIADTGRRSNAATISAALTISGDLPNGPTGEDVIYAYQAFGGTFPRTFAITSGSLPAGLAMDSSGVVSGTRTTPGTYTWTVTVTDAVGAQASLNDTSITTAAMGLTGDVPDGSVGDSVSMSYAASGGTGPYTYAVHSGTFPAGLTLNASTGAVTGSFTTVNNYAWTIRATDSLGAHADLDDTAVVGGDIFVWNAVNVPGMPIGKSIFIDGDTIAVGCLNNKVAYSTDRGVTFTLNNAAHPSSAHISGIVKFGPDDDDWYIFGVWSGGNRMGKGTLSSFASQPISFTPGDQGHSAYVIGGGLYVAEMTLTTGATFKLRKTLDGGTFSSIDTGIVGGALSQSICSHAETSDGWHLFGTTTGKILRSNDLVTFAVVTTLGSGAVSVAALGTTVIAGVTAASSIWRSTNSGASFTSYSVGGACKLLANGRHFISGLGETVQTSTTGESGTWTTRLDTDNLGGGVTASGMGYASGDLAAFSTQGNYVYVGDVS